MSIVPHILCTNIGFSERGTALLKGGLDIWKCTLRSFGGHGANFQGILHILFGYYCHCKNTWHCPKGRLLSMFVLNIYGICWQVWGCCNYFESNIFCRNCVHDEGRKNKKKHETKKWGSELLNVIFMSAISFDEGFYLCSFVTNYVLSCLRMWRTSFVLFSTIFNMTFLFIYLMDISSIRGVWLTGMCQLTLRWRYSASWNV